jgi:acyl carrier protein
MNDKEKLELIEDMLELGRGTLQKNTLLKNIPVWDSMASLSLIALMDEKFGRQLTGDTILQLKNVGDILDLMN